MKSNAKTLLKVLFATAVLCLFTAIGASAEPISGTFYDAAKANAGDDGAISYQYKSGNTTTNRYYKKNNRYKYTFDTVTGKLTIDAAENTSGNMCLDPNNDDGVLKELLPWRNPKTIDPAKITSVEIGSGIKKLGRKLFKGTAITKLTIPATVTGGMERGVANGCTELTTVTFAEDVTEIGDKFAFGCSKLKDVYLPRTVVKVNQRAFGSNQGGTSTIHFYPLADVLDDIAGMKNGTNKANNTGLTYDTINTMYSGDFTDNANNVFKYALSADFNVVSYDWTTLPAVTKTLTVDSKDGTKKNITYTDTEIAYPWNGKWNTLVDKIAFGENLTNVGRQMCKNMTSLKVVTIPRVCHKH